jgi:hypothetical protein
LKKHKPWFNRKWSKLLDQRKQAKLLWLLSHEASRHLRNRRREYLTDKINEFAMNSKNKNITDLHREINEFKRCYQPRSYLERNENSDLHAESHSVLNRLKNYLFQLLNALVSVMLDRNTYS